jgi:3-oxoadipate enol-lactonase
MHDPTNERHGETVMPWIEANGASLRYELSGSGSNAIVLMHEAGGCIESYDEAVPMLAASHRVLRYDQRGFGFSEKARELTFDGVVADLAALLDALDLRAPVILAGCAMGADYAVGFASQHPGRVARLMLASPTMGNNAARSAQSLERAALVEREGIRASMASSHDRSYPEHLRTVDRERFRRYQSRWVCNTPASFTAQARMMAAVDLTPAYARIAAPTLVVGAKHDALRPPELAQRVAASIPHARYVEADTGHFMNVQTPALFAQTLQEFVSGS